jgi:heme/copper-type cytochrome/quinol oxidase subunit 3
MSEVALEKRPLPTGSIHHLASGWWGMLGLILTEGALFGYLLFSYFYLAIQPHTTGWPPGGPPELKLALPNTAILLASSVAAWWGEQGVHNRSRGQQTLGIGIAFLLGAIFVAVQVFEWKSRPFSISSHPYGSLYFTITGFHMAHVVAGLIALAALFIWAALGYFGPRRDAAISIGMIYWHFVDAIWLAVFFTFYITPRLG